MNLQCEVCEGEGIQTFSDDNVTECDACAGSGYRLKETLDWLLENTIEARVAKLDLKEGQTLLVTCEGLSAADLEGVKLGIKPYLPQGVNLLVVHEKIKFEVISSEEAEDAASS